MFSKLFSFRGRIRRNEYALTLAFFMIVAFIMLSILGRTKGTDHDVMIFFNFLLPLAFVLAAQGAKRSHDLGYSGWYQLIPFFAVWLLIADGKPGPNRFGNNPKGVGNDSRFSFEEKQVAGRR